MPPNIDLQAIGAARRSLAEAEANLTATGVEVAAVQAERDRLVREGAGAATLRRRQDTRLADLQSRKGQTVTDLKGHAETIRQLSESALAQFDPALLVETLTAGCPLLLPVRLETRFFNNATELRIRIYPIRSTSTRTSRS